MPPQRIDPLSNEHLRRFTEEVRSAPSDEMAERIVRYMLASVAKDCPMTALVQLGQCLIDIRKAELREEAENN